LQFYTVAKFIFSHVNRWFHANRFVLILDKTNIKICNNNLPHCALSFFFLKKSVYMR